MPFRGDFLVESRLGTRQSLVSVTNYHAEAIVRFRFRTYLGVSLFQFACYLTTGEAGRQVRQAGNTDRHDMFYSLLLFRLLCSLNSSLPNVGPSLI